MTTARKVIPLMDTIADVLAKRRDIQILATGDGTIGQRIVGVQLSRIWNKKIWNASVFSPHERELWHYYGQAFLIEEADVDRKGKINAQQLALKKAMEKVGTIAILAKNTSDLAPLGDEPQNIVEYFRRLEK